MKIVLFIIVIGVFSLCTSPVAGGGTESTNGYVTGLLVDENGAPANNTRVMLLPDTYNPVKDRPIPDSLIDTTDESGKFQLISASKGRFYIEVHQLNTGNRALLSNIIVELRDTLILPTHEIKKPGAVKLIHLSGDFTKNGYIYIPGSTWFTAIDNQTAFLDSVPSGYIPQIKFTDASNLKEDSTIVSGFTVTREDTLVIANSSIWKFSRKLHFNTTGSGADVRGTVTNFPLLIRLTSDNFDFNQARTDGSDIRFVKENGASFPYEIERWNADKKNAELWVKIDTLFGNSSEQFIVMYWGNTNAQSQSNSSAVFDTAVGFSGVWHMGQPENAIVSDATGNRIDGIATSTTTVSGTIGEAQLFNGTSSLIQASGPTSSNVNFPDTGTYSVSAWVTTATLDTLCQAIVFKSNAQYGLQIVPEKEWEFNTYTEKTMWEGSRSPASSGSWHLVTGIRNGTKQYLYVDGVCVDSTVSDVIALASEKVSRAYDKPLEIGHCPDGGKNPDRFFNGVIDEVRISGIALNADWIRLCYMNQKEMDALVK